MELEPFVLPALDDVAVPAASPPAEWYRLCPVEESFVEESTDIDCLPDLDWDFEDVDSCDVSILSSLFFIPMHPFSSDLATNLSITPMSRFIMG